MSRNAVRLVVCLISLLIAATAFAQNNRSAVSVTGSDGNACTTISPCRSISVALTHTNPGGEVIAIDSDGYGAFTISQSVSVIGAPGIHAALTVTSGDGIDVTAASNDVVKIRGLNITLTTNIGRGIYATTFKKLFIENCSVNGGEEGILIAGSSNSNASVADTVTHAALSGFVIQSRAALVRCRAEGNSGTGLSVQAGSAADGALSAVDFVSTGNADGAIANSGTAGHTVTLSLDHALLSNNAFNGVHSVQVGSPGPEAYVRVTNSTATDNGNYGFDQIGNSFFGSMNNNLVEGNALSNTQGTISPITAH